jgi:hypothetical protein
MTDDRTPAEGPADETDQDRDRDRDRDRDAQDAGAAGAPETGEATHHEPAPAADPAPAGRPAGAGAPGPDPAPPSAAAAAPAVAQAPAAPPLGASGWAVAALVVGIGAFLVGLVPVVGLLVALVGVALGVVALVRRRRAQSGLGLGVTGVVLSGVAALTNVALLAALVVVVPLGARIADEAAGSWSGWDQGQGLDGDPTGPGTWPDEGTGGTVDPADVTTDCWSFSLPDDAWTASDDTDAEACTTSLEIADEVAATSVEVVSVPAAVSAVLVPATSTDRVADAVAALRPSWLPGVGTVVGEPEATTLGGQPAAVVRLAAGSDLAAPAAVVVVWSPADAAGASSLTLVAVGGDDDDSWSGDATDAARAAATDRALTSLTTTWDWAAV